MLRIDRKRSVDLRQCLVDAIRVVETHREVGADVDVVGVELERRLVPRNREVRPIGVEIHVAELDPDARTEDYAWMFTHLGTADRQWVVIPGGDHAALLEDTAPRMITAIHAFIERS